MRAAFDAAVEAGKVPLKVGDAATSRGQPCTVIEIDYDADTCKLGFSAGGVDVDKEYTCIYKGSGAAGRARRFPKGSARLRRAPPSLRPPPREERSDATLEPARPKVEQLFDAEGARSPAARDQVRRRLGAGLYEKAQALYVYSKYAALYALYRVRYPGNPLSFASFKKLRPWYVRRAKEETCLCKHCVNFKNYQTVLHSLPKLFGPFLDVPETEADADDACDGDDTPEGATSGKGRRRSSNSSTSASCVPSRTCASTCSVTAPSTAASRAASTAGAAAAASKSSGRSRCGST